MKLFAQLPGVVVSSKVTVAVPQLSVAVNVAAAGMSAEQDTVTVAAGNAPTNVGFTSSFTGNVCVCVVVFPHASVAVDVLITVQSFTQVPATASCTKLTTTFPPSTVPVNATAAGPAGAHETVISCGKSSVNTGFTKSVMLMICVHVSVLHCSSVTVNVLVNIFTPFKQDDIAESL